MNGYHVTTDGRWKAKEKPGKGKTPASVTLTDTTRRTRFQDTGESWTRLDDWRAGGEVIRAHLAATTTR